MLLTFIPVFSVFSVILVAFAMSFYILWHQVRALSARVTLLIHWFKSSLLAWEYF